MASLKQNKTKKKLVSKLYRIMYVLKLSRQLYAIKSSSAISCEKMEPVFKTDCLHQGVDVMNDTATLYLCPLSEGTATSCPSVDHRFPQLIPSSLGLSPQKTSLFISLRFNVSPLARILAHVTMA
jgi:hypothetical protein